MDLAPEKTYVMLISGRHAPLGTPTPIILLNGRELPLQSSLTILKVELNSIQTFTGHVRTISKRTTWKLSCVRCLTCSTPRRSPSCTRPRTAFLCSTYFSRDLPTSPSYLSLLDNIQIQAQRLTHLKAQPDRCSRTMCHL